eukprot:7332519-Pyramimonas_sp.AAC.1
MTRIQSTGLAPSVLHGAAVMGVAEHVLKLVRSLAGALAGVTTAASLITCAAMQRSPRYDPIFAATLELPYLYASWLWGGQGIARATAAVSYTHLTLPTILLV